jgi:hypothetical protein
MLAELVAGKAAVADPAKVAAAIKAVVEVVPAGVGLGWVLGVLMAAPPGMVVSVTGLEVAGILGTVAVTALTAPV